MLATGGGAFMDPETRAMIRERGLSVWLRCALPILLARTQGRTHRPLLNAGNPAETLARLSAQRSPFYAQADIIVDGSEDPAHVTTDKVIAAIAAYNPPLRVPVALSQSRYDVVIGANLLPRAGR